MATRKTPVDKLGAEIRKILNDYEVEASGVVADAVRKVTTAGAKALRAQSRETFQTHSKEKPYYKGWASTLDTKKRSAQGIIYNKDVPGLPHLLEHGHANRGGGRTPGRVHIKIIEDEVIKDFTKEVERGL